MAELLSDFLSKPLPKVPHIIGRGVLPNRALMVVGGEPKANKSFVILNMAVDLARGRSIFGATFHDSGKPVLPVPHPVRVLYIEQEIGDEGVRDRMLPMFGGEVPFGLDLYIKSRDMAMRLDTDEGKLAIAQEIEQVKPHVLILDPLAEFQLINENSAQEMGATIRVLKRWIEKYDLSVILVHHVAKPDFEHPRKGGNALRGSGALFGAVDSYIRVTRKSEGDHPTPTLELSFELRRGKPVHPIYVVREESGLITYKGGKWDAGVTLEQPILDAAPAFTAERKARKKAMAASFKPEL